MKSNNHQFKVFFFRNTPFKLILFLIIILMSNLNAIVDSFLHPDIPYFDEEHLIVGGVTGLVSAVLFTLILFYTRHLEQALIKIRMLETFLPICSNCRKIQIANTDRTKMESWQSIEDYLTENTTTSLSHGICPDCMKKLYPEFDEVSKSS